MNCLESLDIPAGVTSVVGSGGKTTLLRALADELAPRDERVILATTTHFLAFPGVPLVTGADEGELGRALGRSGVVCVGSPVARGGSDGTPARAQAQSPARTQAQARAQMQAHIVARTSGVAKALPKLGPSPIPIARLAQLAGHVLVEADGSRRLPLKAHASHEPVVPTQTARCVLVVGASGFGRAVAEVAHRPELFYKRAGCEPSAIATPELVARVVAAETRAGTIAPDSIVVNQAEEGERREEARTLARELARLGVGTPILAGSIRAHDLELIG